MAIAGECCSGGEGGAAWIRTWEMACCSWWRPRPAPERSDGEACTAAVGQDSVHRQQGNELEAAKARSSGRRGALGDMLRLVAVIAHEPAQRRGGRRRYGPG